jgi:pimeloyl-ACP methyl ester carboxylesterase
MSETDHRPTQNGLLNVRGSKLNIHRMGTGEPLLFLHGAQGLDGTEAALRALADHFDVIAPDHPGFGSSEDSDLVDDVRDLALFYFDLLDELGFDHVHVVGHCIGGWVALEMAVASSGRFKSLGLVNSAGIRLKGVPRGDMFISSEDDLLKLLFARDGAEWLKRWRATREREDIYDRNRAAAAKLSWSPRLCNPKLDRWLHRIDVPTHIVWGGENRLVPPAYAKALQERIAGSSVRIIPGCAHLLHIEQPQVLAEEISSFIRRVAS